MGKVFFSYSRHDQEFTDTLTRGLTRHGVSVWVDTSDIKAGDAWRAAIAHAIADCDAFLVILSPQCIASKNVVKELSIAESHDRTIIPVRYQECQIPEAMEYQLAGLQYIDFSKASVEEGIEQLVRILKGEDSQQKAAAASVAPSPSEKVSDESFTPAKELRPGTGESYAFSTSQTAESAQLPLRDLAQFLCGRWGVESQGIPGIASAVVEFELLAGGAFKGQIENQFGVISMINGTWQVSPQGQLALAGQQTVGFQTVPYFVLFTFTNRSGSATLEGITGVGERVTWRRLEQ